MRKVAWVAVVRALISINATIWRSFSRFCFVDSVLIYSSALQCDLLHNTCVVVEKSIVVLKHKRIMSTNETFYFLTDGTDDVVTLRSRTMSTTSTAVTRKS